MVLCQYYLNNSCHFGSKCVNDHFDIRQLIKTEVEAAIKGTQWPLSCFGPFKEKPCLPNFINDQSYEEVRFLCYEAKKQNNFPAYTQQFAQEVMGAQNRMKSLLTLSRDVVEAVVTLYNSQDANASQPAQKSNPFSMPGGGGVPVGFGAAPNTNANSLFGSNTSQGNPFASSGFGSVVQSTGSIFGGTPTATATTAGLFGQQAGFGANNTFGAPNSSVFGGTQQQPQSNAFSLAHIGGAQAINQAGNAFGMAAAPSAFGASTGLFSAQNAAPQSGLFAQQSSQMQSAGLFGQTTVQSQQQSQTLGFGTQPVQQHPSMFAQAPTTPGQSVFGGVLPGMQQQPQQNAFGTVLQIAQPQMQQQPAMGFGNNQLNSPFSGLHQQQVQQQVNNQMPVGTGLGNIGAGNVFQQIAQQPFGVPNNGNIIGTSNDCYLNSAYSRMEDLPQDALEAFKAPEFIIGKLPTMPPPRELC